MSVPERASLWGIRKERKRKKGWTDYIGDPSEAVGTSLEPRTPGPPPSPRVPPPPPIMTVPTGMFDTPPPIPPLPKRPGSSPSSTSSTSPDETSISSSDSPSSPALSSLEIDTSALSAEVSDTDTLSPLAQDESEARDDDTIDQALLDQIEIEVEPKSPFIGEGLEMEIDWEGLINERLARGKPNSVLPGLSRPSQSFTVPAEFIETPTKKVERKKKDLSGFDLMAYLRAGPPIPHMPSWAEEHRKFLLDRQMRQKFEPPFRLFCVREDQGSQRQPWPMPWEDSDRDPSDSEQEELARQERKAARQAKRRAKRRAMKKEERRRQREELLKQAKKLAQQEVDEARAARVDAESRDSDDDEERKSFGKLLSVDSDSNDDQDEDEVSEESLGTEAETTPSEDDDSFTDMAKQLSHKTPWIKKRLSEIITKDDSDEEPQSELEKRLVKGDKFRMYDGPESDDIKIFVDIKHRCLRFEGSVDDGVSLTTSSFQLKRGICDLDENNQLQPTTIFPEPGMNPEVCMTLATGRANEKGVLQATNAEQIDAWVDGVYSLREKFLDDALRLAMRQVTDSEEEEDEASSGDDEMEVSFEHPSSSPKITPKKKLKSLMRDINSSESEDEEDQGERIENVIKSTHAIPLEWTVVNNNTSTIADISPVSKKLLQEEQGSSDEGDDGIPEAIIHLPTHAKPKRVRRRASFKTSVPTSTVTLDNAFSNMVTEATAVHPEKDSSQPTGEEVTANRDMEPAISAGVDTKLPGSNARPLETVPRVNSRTGRARRAAVAVKPSVPIPRHIPEDEETDSAEAKAEAPVQFMPAIEQNESKRVESEAEKQMRELETAIGFGSTGQPFTEVESEAVKQRREPELTGEFKDTEIKSRASIVAGQEAVESLEVGLSETRPSPVYQSEIENDDLNQNTQDRNTLTHAERQMKALEADFGFEPMLTELKQEARLENILPEQNKEISSATTTLSEKSESENESESDEQQVVQKEQLNFEQSKQGEQQMTDAERQMRALEADFGFEPTSEELKQVATAEISSPTQHSTSSTSIDEEAPKAASSLTSATETKDAVESHTDDIEKKIEDSDTNTQQKHDEIVISEAQNQMKDLETAFVSEATSSALSQEEMTLLDKLSDLGPAHDEDASSLHPTNANVDQSNSLEGTSVLQTNLGESLSQNQPRDENVPLTVVQPEVLESKLSSEALFSFGDAAPVLTEQKQSVVSENAEEKATSITSDTRASSSVESSTDFSNLNVENQKQTSDVNETRKVEKATNSITMSEDNSPKKTNPRAGRTRRSAVAVKPETPILRQNIDNETDASLPPSNVHVATETEVTTSMPRLQVRNMSESLDKITENQPSEVAQERTSLISEPVMEQGGSLSLESEAAKQMRELEAAIGFEDVASLNSQAKVESNLELFSAESKAEQHNQAVEVPPLKNEEEKQSVFQLFDIASQHSTERNVCEPERIEKQLMPSEESLSIVPEVPEADVAYSELVPSSIVSSFPQHTESMVSSAPASDNTVNTIDSQQYSMFWRDTVAQLEQSQPEQSEVEPVLAVAVDMPSSQFPLSDVIPAEARGIPIGEEPDGKASSKGGLTEPLLLEDPAHTPKRRSKSICGDCVLL